jgi:hypothetical protein
MSAENVTDVKAKAKHRAIPIDHAGEGGPLFGSTPTDAADIKEIVAEASGNRRELLKDLESSISQTVDSRLIAFGLEEDDRKELLADLRHLRGLRKRTEQVHSFVLKAFITAVLTGALGAVWLGLRSAIGR